MRGHLLIAVALAAGCTEAEFAGDDDAAVADLGGADGSAEVDASDPGRDLGPPVDLGPVDLGPPDMPPDLGPCEPCGPGVGDLVISEIMADTDVVSDDFGEWFEIHNPSATVTYDLDGCIVADSSNSHPISGETLVAPGAYLSLARFGSAAVGGFSPDYDYGMTLKFANEGDIVRLSCAGAVVDLVDFNSFGVDKGISLALDPDALDTVSNDDVANWCLGQSPYNSGGGETDFGSPGLANPDCP
ncbi:MAG: lamin tail domain-containing protein [Deltaproteobacteria bacterium]|nr:lamin tail domain-containing protein [Deltaproteobacteria bacterium]